MSSLEDLHSTNDDTSVTTPFISMETTLTGMATVLPVSIAVLMISVSWGEQEDKYIRLPLSPLVQYNLLLGTRTFHSITKRKSTDYAPKLFSVVDPVRF